MHHSESITALATALAKAQSVMQPAIKDATNPHFKSKYADLAGIWEACRKPLTDHGLSIVQAPANSEPGSVALTTMLLHSSGEWMSSTVSAPLQQNTAQAVGSALTYLRRYALAAMAGVTSDDDDGNAASSQPQPRKPAEYVPYVPVPLDKPAPQSADQVTEVKAKFVAKFGPWNQHYSLPEPRTRQGWIEAGRELADRIAHATQAPLSDEYDAIEGTNHAAAGVAK